MTDVLRPIGTYLYGREMYQTMAVWQTPEVIPGQTPATLGFARIWQAADKIVYSAAPDTRRAEYVKHGWPSVPAPIDRGPGTRRIKSM